MTTLRDKVPQADLPSVGTLAAAASGDATGATDAAAISAAIAALPNGRGVVQLRQGIYYDNLQRDFSASTAVTLRGVTGQSAGAAPGTILEYTGTAASYLKLGNSIGFSLEDLMLLYTKVGFTGALVDTSSGSDTVYLRLSRFYLGSTGGLTSASAIINLSNAQDVTIEQGAISGGTYGIIGRSSVGQFSNAVAISGVHFAGNATRHVKNAGQGWVFDDGCVFEPIVSGGAGAYSSDFTGGPLTFDSAVMGDVTIAGTTQVAFSGIGLNVRGCVIGNNALGGGSGIVIGANSSGIAIRGNQFAENGIAVDVTAGGITNVDVAANAYRNVTTRLAVSPLVYSASITPDAAIDPWQTVTVTDSTAFTINAPANPPSSTATGELTIEVLNSSGGAMGAITWNAAFVFAVGAWSNPANTKSRFARFEWNGTKWICTSLASADY